jgi:hypothetical protein
MAIRHLALDPLFLALLLVPAAATTVEAPDVGTLLSQSDYVVRAVVKSATPEWREHAGRRYIGTRVELEIKEVIKGTPPSPLVINLIGGRIGPDELIVEGMPGFRAGDDRVLFVHGEQRQMFPLVALMHGVYPIIHDAQSGQDYVLRSNGHPLYRAEDVSLPMDRHSQARPLPPGARPLTVAAFINQLRARPEATPAPTREK